MKSLGVRDSLGFIARDYAFLNCLAHQLVTIDARAVVGAFNNDLIALMEGV